jgi:hypothetical protein
MTVVGCVCLLIAVPSGVLMVVGFARWCEGQVDSSRHSSSGCWVLCFFHWRQWKTVSEPTYKVQLRRLCGSGSYLLGEFPFLCNVCMLPTVSILRASPAVLSMWPCNFFFTSKFSYLLFFQPHS